MGKEIERKFLVGSNKWKILGGKKKSIRQGFLSTEKGRVVRIRTVDNKKAFLTIKGKSKGITRDEFEYPIPIDDAKNMLTMCISPIIDKTRTVIDEIDGLTWEIDEFNNENYPLTIAEVELKDENQEVILPDWIGEEVSKDYRYSNNNLVKRPYTTWGN